MLNRNPDVLSVVQQSPAHVLVHNRDGWLGLFNDGAWIEDPVGSPPATKSDGKLGRFWDTFIAPHHIVFEVARDHIVGRDVFRDVVIHTTINDKIHIDVPAYLLYELDERLQVKRMTAHWQLGVLSLGAMKLGPRAWVAMTLLFARMIQRMGPAWVMGYLSSLWRGIGKRGVKLLGAFADAVAAHDQGAAAAPFTDDATVALGDKEAPAKDALSLFGDGKLAIETPIHAGWTTTFRFRVTGARASEGLGIAEFDPGSRRIKRARFFPA